MLLGNFCKAMSGKAGFALKATDPQRALTSWIRRFAVTSSCIGVPHWEGIALIDHLPNAGSLVAPKLILKLIIFRAVSLVAVP